MNTRTCIGLVSHLLNQPVRAVFERLRSEAPPGYDVRMILSTDDPDAGLAGLAEADVDRISREQIFELPYPTKCQLKDWEMGGNLDLVFLEFYRRYPGYDRYWFTEYDVFWQGRWSVFFDYFEPSAADLLAATIHTVDEVPHKADPTYPRQSVPEGMVWERARVIKAFLPICRLSRQVLHALDGAYRAGLGGHYEIKRADRRRTERDGAGGFRRERVVCAPRQCQPLLFRPRRHVLALARELRLPTGPARAAAPEHALASGEARGRPVVVPARV